MTNIIEDLLLGPSADWPFFPEGAGEAGKILRQTDWANTTLGAPQHWPVALRALVSVMMGSNQPMFIAWGPERTLLYNSSYAAILDDKHPSAMGCNFFWKFGLRYRTISCQLLRTLTTASRST